MYSQVGGGHLSAARALASELADSGQGTTRIVDAYLECARFPVTRFPAAYAQLARYHPRLWSAVYRQTQRGLNPDLVLGPFLASGVKRLFAEEQPDVVVSVLPGVNGILATAASLAGARLEVVLTDWHSVHPFWVARGVDHYTAPTDSARGDCIRLGAAPQDVEVVGIPVRKAFAASLDRRQRHAIRTRRLSALGLEPSRCTILMMAGAEGSPRARESVSQLAASDLDAQLVVVCGRNDSLRKHVERLEPRMSVRALGFVEDVADLMRSADVLVTKAGGLTLAEAFCCGVPVVVQDVLPGQEAGNIEYVQRQGAVVYAPQPGALLGAITELVADARQRAALAEAGARLARPGAARQIAQNLLARLEASRA